MGLLSESGSRGLARRRSSVDAVASGNVGGAWCYEGYGDVHAGPAGAVLAGGQHQVPRGVHARVVFERAVSPAAIGSDLVAEVRPQVERILSLDVDGSGFPEWASATR